MDRQMDRWTDGRTDSRPQPLNPNMSSHYCMSHIKNQHRIKAPSDRMGLVKHLTKIRGKMGRDWVWQQQLTWTKACISTMKHPGNTRPTPFESPPRAPSESTIIWLQMFLQMLQMMYRWGQKQRQLMEDSLLRWWTSVVRGSKRFFMSLFSHN